MLPFVWLIGRLIEEEAKAQEKESQDYSSAPGWK